MRVLVTGASGVLGSEVGAQLAGGGNEVHGVGRGERPSLWPGEWHVCDLRDADAVGQVVRVAGPDAVVHAAGAAAGSLAELLETNVVATANVLDTTGGLRVVVAGSSAEVAGSPVQPVPDDAPLSPLTDYGVSKAAQALLARSREGVVHARIFNLIGPRIPRSLAPGAFAAQVVAAERDGGGEVVTGWLGAERDYVDVRDAAAALALLLTADVAGTVNVCSGVATPVRRLLEELVAVAREPVTFREETPSDLRADAPTQVGDPSRLAAAGWRAAIPFEESIRDLLDGWRAQTV